MPKKSLNEIELDLYMPVIIKTIVGMFLFAIFIFSFQTYINLFNPKQKAFIKKSRYAYNKISKEIYEIYKQREYIFDPNNENSDEICLKLAKKFASKNINCTPSSTGFPVKNFTFKGKNIAIYGLEQPGFMYGDSIVKDFIIDTDETEKSANEFGLDRIPVRIYSTGRMGGLLSPVNCSHTDERDFGIPRAKICPNGVEDDYLATNMPFGFNVSQVGSPEGKVKQLNTNVSFLRADCAAFGGEIIADEYCDAKGIYWLRGCYDEYYCSIEPTGLK